MLWLGSPRGTAFCDPVQASSTVLLLDCGAMRPCPFRSLSNALIRGVLPLLLLSLWWPSAAAAQSDAQLWLSAGVRFRVHRAVHLDLEQGLRFDENMSHLGRVLPEVGLSVRPTDWLRLSAGYRFTWVNDNNPDGRHRVQLDARASGELGRFEWVYRLRYQAGLREGRTTRHALRSLIEAGVDTGTPVTPVASTEIFTSMGHGEGVELYAWRGTVGLDIEHERHNLSLFYRLEIPIRDPGEPTLHILGLGYRYDLKLY